MDEAIAGRDAALASIADKFVAEQGRANLRDAEITARNGEIARLRVRLEELERIANRLAERVVERERELRGLREELAGERRNGGEGMEALTALAGEIDAVRRQARGQATRIRLAALRQAADVSEMVKEIAERPGDGAERLAEALATALDRVGTGDDEAGTTHLRRARDEFEGLVEIEIGPLADFSQLVGFEDAARSIAATSELSIRRFSEGRATLTMSLTEPVELLHELETRCDLAFTVRERGTGRLVLDVADGPPAAAAA